MQFDRIVGRDGPVIFFQLKNGLYGTATSEKKHDGDIIRVSKLIDSFLRFMPYTKPCTAEDLSGEEMEIFMYNITHNKVADALKRNAIIADHIEVN